jgi:hypothetical protein
MAEKFSRIHRRLTDEQKEIYDEIRRQAKVDFPPLQPPRGPSERGRLALAIREARRSQGLTFEQLAERSGIGDPMRFAILNTARTLNFRISPRSPTL